ncbi:hypothetical protein MGYG_09164 [Nannizzia gypsea CBS 118893]|uniref:Uncharacterized protein n=1 Tax=Arthroderma gypseum (strain ATCC MYA-4604 / CBS 118893) TaxID=535722 RepID=E4V3U1_ARTGP|nr:hypothetical protein MGYG_09164 [Nannizzia gypsea CBS 118893]EFR04665.1 hypothetical protein MGYG_09164 [Nannizzia gypsea CBS 118893]
MEDKQRRWRRQRRRRQEEDEKKNKNKKNKTRKTRRSDVDFASKPSVYPTGLLAISYLRPTTPPLVARPNLQPLEEVPCALAAINYFAWEAGGLVGGPQQRLCL